ncbi:MAG: hypothetical protein R3D55_08520 [Chloroflexota bacterium]
MAQTSFRMPTPSANLFSMKSSKAKINCGAQCPARPQLRHRPKRYGHAVAALHHVHTIYTRNRIIGAIYVENRSTSDRFSDEDLIPTNFLATRQPSPLKMPTSMKTWNTW